jgi:hypothetical protein
MMTAPASARGGGTTIRGALLGAAGRPVARRHASAADSDADTARIARITSTSRAVAG